MTNLRLRLVEIGLIATLGLAGASRPVAAEPDRDDGDDVQIEVGTDRDLNYVYFRTDKSTTMSGRISDIDRARRYKQPNERIVWFRDGGREYVIRDAAAFKEIETIWRAVQGLGEAQSKLGKQMSELGHKMEELGSQQGLLGARQGTLSTREAALSMRESRRSLSDAQRAEIARQREALQQEIRELDKQVQALEKPIKELDRRMEPLSREMDALGKKMEAAEHKASGEMRSLFQRAIASGVARQVK